MKKVALTVAVLALGLAACETKTENAVENVGVENAVEEDAMAADNAVDNALDAAGNAVENAGEAVENAAEATEDAAGNAM
jgi:predicted small secreted protein